MTPDVSAEWGLLAAMAKTLPSLGDNTPVLAKAISDLINARVAHALAPLKDVEHGCGSGQLMKALIEVSERAQTRDRA